MSRCGCATGTCPCIVTAGTNVTISGNGSSGSPYIINSTQATLTAVNTTSILTTISSGDISSTVKIDSASGNLLTLASGGLRVACSAVTACISGAIVINGSNTNTVDTTVTGTNPFTVTANANLDPSSNNLLTQSSAGLLVSKATLQSAIGTIAQQRVGFSTTTPGTTAIPASLTQIDTPGITVINPSGTTQGVMMFVVTASVTCSLAAGQGITIELGSSGAFTTPTIYTFVNGGSTTETFVLPLTYNWVDFLAAGGTSTYTAPLSVQTAGSSGGTYSSDTWQISYLLVVTP